MEKVRCPECFEKVDQEELDMFGGLCEACNEERINISGS